jgi:hypothetical protein
MDKLRRSADLTAAEFPSWTPTNGIPGQPSIRSPWSTTDLTKIVWADLLGVEYMPVSRAEAMTVPSVVKARQIIVGKLSPLPLVALDRAGLLTDDKQPAWLYRTTTGAETPWHRNAWTLDDLLFYGWSCWQVTLGSDNFPIDARRIAYGDWQIDPNGFVVWATGPLTGQPIPNVRLFAGPSEGLLVMAARTIRAARNAEIAWAGRVRNPIPVTELHITERDALTDDEQDELVADYSKARMDANGAVVLTPFDVELRTHGEAATDMLVEARNAVRLDVANFTGLPGAALDGSLSTASLTYSTQEGRQSELGEALGLWADPYTARLSQDDFVPRGQRVRFNAEQALSLTPSPTGAKELD